MRWPEMDELKFFGAPRFVIGTVRENEWKFIRWVNECVIDGDRQMEDERWTKGGLATIRNQECVIESIWMYFRDE